MNQNSSRDSQAADHEPVKSSEPSLLRLAIVATPRSGNTWLRHLLTSLYGLKNIVIDRPEQLDVEALPARCVVQLHWPAEASLIELLKRHQIRPVTLYRHPCDVLVSILHFCTTWSNTALWCGGREGDESSIVGQLPSSREFVEYATGSRARLLLQVSPGWALVSECLVVHYESLVSDTDRELRRLTQALEPVSDAQIAAAIEENSLDQLQTLVHNQHYWRGRPGGWRSMIPAVVSRDIMASLGDIFAATGYATASDTGLSNLEADRNWFAVEVTTLRQELSRTREKIKQVNDRSIHQALQLRELRSALANQSADLEALKSVLAALAPLAQLEPQSVLTAQQLDRLSQKHPHMHAAVQQCLRPFLRRAA